MPDDTTSRERLAENIGHSARKARLALRLTQDEVATRMGKSAEFYARIERGNAMPSTSTLVAMCDALDVHADDLMGIDPDVEPPPPRSALADLSPAQARLARRIIKLDPLFTRVVSLLLKASERQKMADS